LYVYKEPLPHVSAIVESH